MLYSYLFFMQIKSAEFVISNSRADQCPNTQLPEYAFIGRSNVGKSSLINCLVGRKSLAMTSSKPGKTLLINHFLVNDEWFLVDLPGYGYAKRSKKETEKLKHLISYYILERQQLTLLFLLIDSRIPPQKIDLEFIDFLGESQIPFAIIFTKTDKSNSNVVQKNVKVFLKELSKTWEELPDYFLSSSQNGKGREDILDFIEKTNVSLQQVANETL